MATSKFPEPRRIDVAALASRGAALQGRTPLREMARLSDGGDDAGAVVEWSVQGMHLTQPGSEAAIALDLHASAVVVRICQRCLEPMQLPLDVRRRLRFVRGEDEAARLDADSDDDVLALRPELDLVELIEDELLLELPIVPRHAHCIDIGRLESAGALPDDASSAAPNPFAALAVLKAGTRGPKH